jgi:hypothetical protein
MVPATISVREIAAGAQVVTCIARHEGVGHIGVYL